MESPQVRPVARSPRSRVAPLAVVAALVALLVAGCAATASEPGTTPADPAAATSSASAAAPAAPDAPEAPEATSEPVPVAAARPLSTSTPRRVRVPSIGADSDLMRLGLNPDRTVEVPPIERPEQAGWYRHAPTPGAKGTSVILGHIDGRGQEGVFYRLQEMKPGQEILVDRADGTEAVFTVTEVENVKKSAFPSQRVYGQAPDAQLRLISCGGALDRAARSYEDNVVVFATLTGTRRA